MILRRERKKRGLTQSEAAKLASMTMPTWRTIEIGGTATKSCIDKAYKSMGLNPNLHWLFVLRTKARDVEAFDELAEKIIPLIKEPKQSKTPYQTV